MPTFQSRLHAAMQAGDLTKADIALWLDAPFASVSYWVNGAEPGIIPRGPRGRMVLKRLKQLEWAIHHGIGMPVPEVLRARDRPKHIRFTRDAVNARVFEGDLTK